MHIEACEPTCMHEIMHTHAHTHTHNNNNKKHNNILFYGNLKPSKFFIQSSKPNYSQNNRLCVCVCVCVCACACMLVCMYVWEQKIVVWFDTLYKICNGLQISIKEYIIITIILFVVAVNMVVFTACFQKMSHEKKSQNAVRYLHSCLVSQHPRVRGQTPAEVRHIWSGLVPPCLSGLHRPFLRLSQSGHIRSSSPPV